MRVVRWMPVSAFPSGRGYYLTRGSFPSSVRALEVDGRAHAIGDWRRLPKGVEPLPARCRIIRHPLRGRPARHPVGCSSSCFGSSSMPSRMNDEVFLYFVYGTTSFILSQVA
jgi:hypothetical protein